MEVKLWNKIRKLQIVNIILMFSMVISFFVVLATISSSNKNCIGFKDCLDFNHFDKYQMNQFVLHTVMAYLAGIAGSYIFPLVLTLIYTKKSGIFYAKADLCVITIFYMLICIGGVNLMMSWKEKLIPIIGVMVTVGHVLDYIISLYYKSHIQEKPILKFIGVYSKQFHNSFE